MNIPMHVQKDREKDQRITPVPRPAEKPDGGATGPEFSEPPPRPTATQTDQDQKAIAPSGAAAPNPRPNLKARAARFRSWEFSVMRF